MQPVPNRPDSPSNVANGHLKSPGRLPAALAADGIRVRKCKDRQPPRPTTNQAPQTSYFQPGRTSQPLTLGKCRADSAVTNDHMQMIGEPAHPASAAAPTPSVASCEPAPGKQMALSDPRSRTAKGN